MKTPSQEALIQRIEQVISDIRFDRIEGPVTFNDDEVHQLAETGEFYPISGTNHTVGGRAPADIGLAYTVKKGLVVAASQHEADSVSKEIPFEKILAYAGILITASFTAVTF